MKSIKILSRRKALERKEKELKKKQLKVKQKLGNLTKKCKHEIVLETLINGIAPSDSSVLKLKCCLFCNDSYPSNTKGTRIKMNDYKFLKRETLENLYLNLREEFPEDTETQIAQKIIKKLDEEGKKLEKE